MTATQTADGRGHGGSDGTSAARLSTLTRLAFLGGPMLSMIDSSVVNIAVPDIVADLHTSLGTAAWAVSGYLLGLAAGLAATPWLARRFGTLPAYQAALAGFIAMSACCAFAPTVGVLIVWPAFFLIQGDKQNAAQLAVLSSLLSSLALSATTEMGSLLICV